MRVFIRDAAATALLGFLGTFIMSLRYVLFASAMFLTFEAVRKLAGTAQGGRGRRWFKDRAGSAMVTYITVGVIGAAVALLYWILINRAVTAYIDKPNDTQARLAFLLEAEKPLRQVALIIDLNQPVPANSLGHFRALLTIMSVDIEARYPNATDPNNPQPTLCVGGRDNELSIEAGVPGQYEEFKALVIERFVYALNPTENISITQLSYGPPTIQQLQLGGVVAGKGPFKTINALDGPQVNLYITEPLLAQIAAVHFVANSYILFSAVASDMARDTGVAMVHEWAGQLDEDERKVPWVRLRLKGPDYERAMRERDDPFPSYVYRPWIPSFDTYTPRRIQ
jgi:hypothetical protein